MSARLRSGVSRAASWPKVRRSCQLARPVPPGELGTVARFDELCQSEGDQDAERHDPEVDE